MNDSLLNTIYKHSNINIITIKISYDTEISKCHAIDFDGMELIW